MIMKTYESLKAETIRVSYAGEVRKKMYVPRLNPEYDREYIRRLIFAEHFDEKIQSARVGSIDFNNLGKPDNIIQFLNGHVFNANWPTVTLYSNSNFKNLRMLITNHTDFMTVDLVHSYYVLNNRLICCYPSEPVIGFGSMATAGNGAFVK